MTYILILGMYVGSRGSGNSNSLTTAEFGNKAACEGEMSIFDYKYEELTGLSHEAYLRIVHEELSTLVKQLKENAEKSKVRNDLITIKVAEIKADLEAALAALDEISSYPPKDCMVCDGGEWAIDIAKNALKSIEGGK